MQRHVSWEMVWVCICTVGMPLITTMIKCVRSWDSFASVGGQAVIPSLTFVGYSYSLRKTHTPWLEFRSDKSSVLKHVKATRFGKASCKPHPLSYRTAISNPSHWCNRALITELPERVHKTSVELSAMETTTTYWLKDLPDECGQYSEFYNRYAKRTHTSARI